MVVDAQTLRNQHHIAVEVHVHVKGEDAMNRTHRFASVIFTAALTILFGGAVYGATAQTTPATEPTAKTHHVVKKARAKAPAQEAASGGARVLGTKETLSGTVAMVDSTNHVLVLTGSNGVPYDFRVTRATRIMISGKKASFGELAEQSNHSASVQFVPRSNGNFAESVTVGG